MSEHLYTLGRVAEVVSARMGAELLERLDVRGERTRGAWLLSVAEAALLNGQPAAKPSARPAGIPSPGAVCMGPGCWARDTAKYGLRDLALCPACFAAFFGEAYRRPSAELRRAAAAAR